MPSPLRSVRILGIHQVNPSPDDFNETVEIQWGTDLTGKRRQEAEQAVQAHYDGLYLIEVQLDPADAMVDWGNFTQKAEGKPREEWQVAYDERLIDASTGVWAFWLHDVDLKKPLATPVGPVQLPAPSPRPPHLMSWGYWVP